MSRFLAQTRRSAASGDEIDTSIAEIRLVLKLNKTKNWNERTEAR